MTRSTSTPRPPLVFLCGLLLGTLLNPASAAGKHPAWFNSGMNNRDITFSPDGRIMLTTVVAPRNLSSVIAISFRTGDVWSPLAVAPFSGHHADIEPMFTPDGTTLFFASKRPRKDRPGDDWDIWHVAYEGDGRWGEPVNPGAPVNTDGNEFYPSLTTDGRLYFTATREDSLGHEDLYRAIPDGKGGYTRVENVGAPVNSKAYEFNAFVAPDESYLIFGSQLREGETGGGDLYISFMEAGGFREPLPLGPEVNTPRLDYCPAVYNGRFYFTSEMPTHHAGRVDMTGMRARYQSPGNGLGDVYWIPFDDIAR